MCHNAMGLTLFNLVKKLYFVIAKEMFLYFFC